MTTYRFINGDETFNNCEAGRLALEEYEGALLRGASHDQAEMAASNYLQRAGYNVNARGGVTIEAAE